ncbi:hypothetical protein B0J17DRAFT_630270 [Rhizoctonia solani]|nr:hypothetical protein B0J17DRAFT_630270 [Rhizoctonia solani]
MSRLKSQTIWAMVMLATWTPSVLAYKVNSTIHDTNLAHVTYSDASIECNNWVYSWFSRPVCSSWSKPWTSGVYHSQDKVATYHSSLNHQLAWITIEFQADPVEDLHVYNGIKFSHAVYTTERPTPWPVEEDHWRYREVIVHDTYPLLYYTPTTVPRWFFWRTDPWSAKVHTTEEGITTSWHEIKSYDEDDRDQWGVETKIKAGAVAIYGAPSAYIENRDSLGLDTSLHEPVLLLRNDTLDLSHETRVFIRLVKTTNRTASIFPFKSISYSENQDYSIPTPLVGTLRNVTVNHDDRAVAYNPGRRCERHGFFGLCNSWFDPWKWREAGPLGSILTYRSTTGQYRVKEDPHITLSFSGSAVYLYGAPDVYATRPFARQHVCINNACRVIDVEQAYLHPPRGDMESTGINEVRGQYQSTTVQDGANSMSIPHPELEPVLIWSTTGLDDKVEHTLRLALAALPTPDNAEMSIVKVVYTQVTYGWREHRPDPPGPAPEDAYSGPLYPPYATEWVPLAHKPPPPTLVAPLPHGQASFTLLLAFAILVTGCLLPPVLNSRWRKTDETEPLLPGPLPPRPQPSHSQAHSEPSSLHSSDGEPQSTDTTNGRKGPPSAPGVHTPDSPSRGLNAADVPPDYLSVVSSGSNFQP